MLRAAGALLLGSFLAAAASSAGAAPRRMDRVYLSPVDGVPRVYTLRTPATYDGTRPMPALLLLHGRGGSRISFQSGPYESRADADGVVLIFWEGRWLPELQAPSTYYVDGANGIPDESDVLACLADAMGAFAIDPDRVHLAGFSQGGKGALLIGLKSAGLFASVAAGAPPTDAWQGQLWNPGFPDFVSAAGGPATSAAPAVRALWYGQSARFLLPAARNLPVGLFHGTADDVVPDSASFFPYRNSHHVADTPGFADARGTTATLAELKAGDPTGYSFASSYPAGLGHDQLAVLSPDALFGFIADRSRAHRPPRVVALSYEGGPRSVAPWLRLGRTTPPDGTPASVTAGLDGSGVRLAPAGSPSVAVDVEAAGLSAATPLAVRVEPGSGAAVRLIGPFPAEVRVSRDGIVLAAGAGYERDGADVLLAADAAGGAFVVEPALDPDLAPDDLLVPALVDAPGLRGIRFRSTLTVANLSSRTALLEARLLGVPAGTATLEVPPRTSRSFGSAVLLGALGLAEGSAPLRLRLLAGEPGLVVASGRVFGGVEGRGTHGLSFPVFPASASVLPAGEEAILLGGTPGRPSRTNLSLLAPFEDSAVTVTLLAPDGTAVRSFPVSLPRLARVQVGDLLGGLAAPARAAVRVTAGRVQAYGTVIDETENGDSYWSPLLPRSGLSSGWTVPAVASAAGRNGATFTSDLLLAAPEGEEVPVTLVFTPRGGGLSVSAAVTLAPGSALAVEDVLATLFPLEVPGAGSLRVSASRPIHAFAVARSDSPSGPASQDTPAIRDGWAITAAAPIAFAGLAESEAARSNLVLVNGAVAGSVTLALLAEDGPRGTVTVELAPGEVRQLDSVARLFEAAPLGAGTLVVDPAPGRSLLASAVRIDNVSNDPAGLAALPLPVR